MRAYKYSFLFARMNQLGLVIQRLHTGLEKRSDIDRVTPRRNRTLPFRSEAATARNQSPGPASDAGIRVMVHRCRLLRFMPDSRSITRTRRRSMPISQLRSDRAMPHIFGCVPRYHICRPRLTPHPPQHKPQRIPPPQRLASIETSAKLATGMHPFHILATRPSGAAMI
jgi:hypothetical protein